MLVRNFEDQSFDNSEYLGLKKDAAFWFPHAFKYVAWFIVFSSIISSSVVLLLYGMSFGMIKTYLWATAFLASFLLGLFITAPIRILLLSIINSLFLKKVPVIIKRQISLSLLSNPPDPVKKMAQLKYRKYNASLYTPTPLYKLQTRFEDIKYNIELRNLAVDMIAYLVFMITVFYIVLINKTPLGFYNNKMVAELILSGKYTNTISFKSVNTYDKFVEYLNETFLPAVLLDSPESIAGEKSDKIHKRNVRSWSVSKHEQLQDQVRKRQILDKLESLSTDYNRSKSIFEKGWTMNNNLKLLGKPRLRQVRVEGSYKQLGKIKTRNLELAPELNLFNIETGDFTLRWERRPPSGLTEAQALPWTYQSAWKTKTLPVYEKYSWYPGGGYILDFARQINDARIILDFMDVFQWVDVKTRAIFIEFTVYNVNTNLFSVVNLAIENSAIGYMIPSYQIHTCKFIFVEHELEYITFIMSGLFALLLFFFLLRESVRIHRTSFKTYLGWTFAVLDLSIVIFGALSLIFMILRSYYVSHLLKELEEADNNKFVSFTYAAFWHSWSVYIEAILVCLASFKFLRLLTFRVIFFQLQLTLSFCYQHFIHLGSLLIIFIIAFAYFFYLTLLNYSVKFSGLGDSLSTLFGRGVAYDDTFDLNLLSKGFSFLTPFFFCLFIIFIAILFVNVFIAVICFYFHVIRHVSLKNKYNILEYLRFFLTKKRQRDILHLREEKKSANDVPDFDVIRLRGGGNIISRLKKKKKVKKQEKDEESASRKIMLKDFITENIFNSIRYLDIEGSRSLAMRNLTASFLAVDEEEKTVFRENAIRALFYSFISRKEEMTRMELNKIKGHYFLVGEKFKTEIFDRRMFYKMKKVIENVGKKKDWFVEDVFNKEIAQFESKLIVLEKKLDHFLIEPTQK